MGRLAGKGGPAGKGRRRALIGLALAATIGLVGIGVSAASSDGYPVRAVPLVVPGTPEPGIGPVTLDATLYLPQGAPREPAVLLAHGFGGSKADLDDQARTLTGRGYVVLAYTARGFGRSGGLIHLDAPRYEVADAQRMLDLLAARPEVLLDGPGDPRVGVVGGSYGGGLALLLAGSDRRVDAIVPQITWHDLRHALFPQFALASPAIRAPAGIDPSAVPGVFKKGWAGVFFGPSRSLSGPIPAGSPSSPAGAPSSPPNSPPSSLTAASRYAACGRFAPDLCALYQSDAATGRPTPALLDLLAASSPSQLLDRITAPTLLIQGETDSLFPLSEADANARGIAAHSTPVKVVWFSGGHDGGAGSDAEVERITDTVNSWLDRYLKRDGSPPDTRFEVTVPSVTVSSANGRATAQVRALPGEPGVTLPGTPATRQITLTPAGGAGTDRVQVVQAPAGAAPAALTGVPGLGAALPGVGSSGAGSALSALPGQVAVFQSAALAGAVRVVGSSRVNLLVSGNGGDATLFGQLYDVDPAGAAVLPQQLVTPVYLPSVPAAGTRVSLALPAIVRDVAAGHRLRLVISTTDSGYAMPSQPRQYRITLAPGQDAVTVPDATMAPVEVGGVRALWPWALALVLAAVAVLVTGRLLQRNRRGGPPDPALADVPLAIDGLGKAYGDGFRAVSDLSFVVQPGWVLGLLGPNGAGKTTTLRMLMGLIRPSEGTIRVFGHPVRPGAPVLSRVGAFVEGPGFLPHVSGLTNLRLYWQATGRPFADAHLDDALEIAGLGDDVHRRVKTYSQGMRQRLAIAQAMLGLPDLLVMDEPTNGLDPPQIREMREVLARYAATGRTVVVSSHLLSEVEQTCSHVVVMHQGRLVAQGPVAQLVGSATTLVLDVDDPHRAADVARGLAGAQDVRATDTGLTLTVVGTSRGELVRALVGAGIEVERLSPQRGLEEVFLALVDQGER